MVRAFFGFHVPAFRCNLFKPDRFPKPVRFKKDFLFNQGYLVNSLYLCFAFQNTISFTMNKKVQLQDLGNKDYKDTWDYQEELFKEIVDIKVQNRQFNSQLPTPNFLLYVEHPHVYTLGKSGDVSNLLLSEKQLEAKGATF